MNIHKNARRCVERIWRCWCWQAVFRKPMRRAACQPVPFAMPAIEAGCRSRQRRRRVGFDESHHTTSFRGTRPYERVDIAASIFLRRQERRCTKVSHLDRKYFYNLKAFEAASRRRRALADKQRSLATKIIGYVLCEQAFVAEAALAGIAILRCDGAQERPLSSITRLHPVAAAQRRDTS
jgi:hypothetical protein